MLALSFLCLKKMPSDHSQPVATCAQRPPQGHLDVSAVRVEKPRLSLMLWVVEAACVVFSFLYGPERNYCSLLSDRRGASSTNLNSEFGLRRVEVLR